MRTCIHGTGPAREGKKQKFQAIMTACLELLALEEFGVKGVILRQGDSQTIVVTCSHQDKTPTCSSVLESIRKHTEAMGPFPKEGVVLGK